MKIVEFWKKHSSVESSHLPALLVAVVLIGAVVFASLPGMAKTTNNIGVLKPSSSRKTLGVSVEVKTTKPNSDADTSETQPSTANNEPAVLGSTSNTAQPPVPATVPTPLPEPSPQPLPVCTPPEKGKYPFCYIPVCTPCTNMPEKCNELNAINRFHCEPCRYNPITDMVCSPRYME